MADDPQFARAFDASPEEQGKRAEHRYYLYEFASHAAALTYAAERVPATYESDGVPLYLQPLAIEEVLPSTFEVRANYLSPDDPANENSEGGDGGESQDRIQFSTLGGTIKRFQSIDNNTRYYGALALPPDKVGPIGVDDSGNVQGVEVFAPKFEFSVISKRSRDEVENGYVEILKRLSGTVAGNPFMGFAKGEVLFLGAEGTTNTTATYTPITYRFAAEDNLENFDVGGINVALKEGWEYLETVYKKVKDTDTNRITSEVESVLVHQVYLYNNFAELGINL